MSEGIAVPVLTLDGTAFDDLAVIAELRIVAELGAASRTDLRLDISDTPDLVNTFQPGAVLGVGVLDGSTTVDVFEGEIVAVGFGRRSDRDTITVEAWDKVHRLGRTVHHAVYLNQSPADILSDVVGLFGLTFAAEGGVLSTQIPYYQAASTPRRILDDFCEREGCEWLNTGGVVTAMKRSNTSLATFNDRNLRSIDLHASGVDQATEVTVKGWDPATQQVLTGTSTTRDEHQNSAEIVSTVSSATDGRGDSTATLPSTVTTQAAAQSEADGLLRRLDSTIVRGRGEADVQPALVPGGIVTLEDLTPEWSGDYYLTGVEHVFGSQRPFVSRFEFGPIHSPSSSSTTAAPLAPVGQWPLIAKVTDTGFGADIQEPMVKVKYPTLDDNLQSDWIRVATPGAGPQRGFIMPYEVDDEVLVTFLGPELSSAVVIGGLHSNASQPPEGLEVVNGHHAVTVFTSTTNAVKIADDDAADSLPGFHLTTADTTIDIDNEKVTVETGSLPITIKNAKASITLQDNGDIEIKGENIKLTGMKNITLSSTSGDVKAEGTNVNLDAKAQLNAKAKGPATLESTAITSVKGSMVQLN